MPRVVTVPIPTTHFEHTQLNNRNGLTLYVDQVMQSAFNGTRLIAGALAPWWVFFDSKRRMKVKPADPLHVIEGFKQMSFFIMLGISQNYRGNENDQLL